MLDTRINYISSAWTRIKNHCRTTVNKKFTEAEPSHKFKQDLLIAEHSPIRCLEIDWTWEDMEYWVSTEHSRHKYEKFITTQRDDRTDNPIPRREKPQGAPVNYDGYANAQNLIDMMRKRLCFQATQEAREAAEDLKRKIKQNGEPELAFVLQKNCIYRGGCPEINKCPYWQKFRERHPDIDLLNIEERYKAAESEFDYQEGDKND